MTMEADQARTEEADELLDSMDDWVHVWHTGPNVGIPLHEFLGLSWEEYKEWVQRPLEWAQKVLQKRKAVPSMLETW